MDRPLFDVLTVVIGSLLSVFDLDGLGLGVEYDVPLTVHGEFHTPIGGEYRFSFFFLFFIAMVHCTVPRCYNKKNRRCLRLCLLQGVYGQCVDILLVIQFLKNMDNFFTVMMLVFQ